MKLSAEMNRQIDRALQVIAPAENERATLNATHLAGAVGRLMSTYYQGMVTLQRVRSGGTQRVLVQHVTVNEGGQAVVAGKVGRGVRGRGATGGRVGK